MNKSQVNALKVRDEKTALYVVAHATWQASRGRKPSEGYRFQKNPRKALALAYSELSELNALGGSTLNLVIAGMIKITKVTKRICKTNFNSVELSVTADDTVENIAAFYHAELNRKWEEYQQSPEGIAAKEREHQRVLALQRQVVKSFTELETLDMTDLAAVISWLGEIQQATDDRRSNASANLIVEHFEKAGYVAGVNCGDDHDENDMENSGRYLIGQALSCLKSMGSIHQVYPRFQRDWEERFLPKAT